jgi:hypothetical protein
LPELGFTPDEAGTLVYAGIGFGHGQQSLPKPTATTSSSSWS